MAACIEGFMPKLPVAPAAPVPVLSIPDYPPELDEKLREWTKELGPRGAVVDRIAEAVGTWAFSEGAAAALGGAK
jgi:hypothetical protein